MDYHQRLYRERTATALRRAALLGALSLEGRPSEPQDMRRLRQLDALRSSRMPTMASVASAAGAATVALANDAWKEHMPMEERTSSKALLATIEQRVYHVINPRFLPPDGRSLIRRNLKLAPIERLLRLQCATFKHSLCTVLLISSILILLLFPSIQLAGKGFRLMCHLFSFRTLHSSTFAPTK